MSFKTTILAAIAAVSLVAPAYAEGLMVTDSYARSSSPVAKAGAAFLTIENHGEDDTLIGASSDAAKRVELHTHIKADDGVMQMREVEGGMPVPAHEGLKMKRGGYHVMFMGLNEPFVQGETITVTLQFEKAGEMVVEVPVDLERKPEMKMEGHDHEHKHGDDESHSHSD
ncbi:copper chaperone PCu(A)C [Lentibacter algarum]|uniref:copper chaperone PCu(A)C n=1 Tax=Lentibacter algarum TaxID=576131 RepID=UPI001C09C545|nr:copper chaperone PCu(A)C [Lentibacter algarum]MBU2983613.1 copper chaperone PCu(A)C [Lentibacter algarum]